MISCPTTHTVIKHSLKGAFVVVVPSILDLLLLVLGELHDFENHLQQADLHRRVIRGEVLRQYVLQIMRIETIANLDLKLLGILLIGLNNLIMIGLQLVQLLRLETDLL